MYNVYTYAHVHLQVQNVISKFISTVTLEKKHIKVQAISCRKSDCNLFSNRLAFEFYKQQRAI